MISVQNILNMPLMENARVIAGHSGLNRQVSHVTVMEVPDIKQWLKGNDLLITCFYSVRKSEEEQCRLVEDLADTCACIAVKTGQYVRTLADSVKAAADRLGLPLIEIPYHLAYIDILVSVMNRLMEDKGAEEVMQKFLKDVLYENYCDRTLMTERGRLLGLDIEQHYFAAMLLSLRNAEQTPGTVRFERWAHDLRNHIKQQPAIHGCYRVTAENGTLLLIEAADPSALQKLMDGYASESSLSGITNLDAKAAGLGLGSVEKGLTGIRASHIAACKAFQVGNCLYPKRSVYPYNRLGHLCVCHELFAKDDQQALAAVLLKLHNAELVDTLSAYFECEGNMDELAEKLFVHKNTVKYRLNRLQERTGLSLKSPGDAFQLYLAVLALKFKQHKLPL